MNDENRSPKLGTEITDSQHDPMERNVARYRTLAARIATEAIDPFTDGGRLSMRLFHQTSHDGGPQPWVSVHCENNERRHGVHVLFGPSDQLRGAVPEQLPAGTVRLRVDSDAVQELRLLEWNDRLVRIDLAPSDATAFVDRLATARAMTLDYSDAPTLRFDVAKGRPVIGDFRAKCRSVLGAAGGR